MSSTHSPPGRWSRTCSGPARHSCSSYSSPSRWRCSRPFASEASRTASAATSRSGSRPASCTGNQLVRGAPPAGADLRPRPELGPWEQGFQHTTFGYMNPCLPKLLWGGLLAGERLHRGLALRLPELPQGRRLAGPGGLRRPARADAPRAPLRPVVGGPLGGADGLRGRRELRRRGARGALGGRRRGPWRSTSPRPWCNRPRPTSAPTTSCCRSCWRSGGGRSRVGTSWPASAACAPRSRRASWPACSAGSPPRAS